MSVVACWISFQQDFLPLFFNQLIHIHLQHEYVKGIQVWLVTPRYTRLQIAQQFQDSALERSRFDYTWLVHIFCQQHSAIDFINAQQYGPD